MQVSMRFKLCCVKSAPLLFDSNEFIGQNNGWSRLSDLHRCSQHETKHNVSRRKPLACPNQRIVNEALAEIADFHSVFEFHVKRVPKPAL